MHNLLRILQKYNFFFLFLLMQTIALGLTVTNRQYHQSFFMHSGNIVTAKIYQYANNLTSYFKLKEINRALMEEYAQLLNQQTISLIITDNKVFLREDSIIRRRYEYMHAEVINNSIISRNNYITLNKGYLHGVRSDMGIITSNGVAGIIINTTDNFSVAMSLLHSDMLVSTKILNTNHIGTLRWEGVNYREASMTYIPPHLELNVGDSIVTSGFSTVFPENVFIGIIKDWEIRRGENFYTASIELALDFNKLSYVYIVKNLLKDEQIELESSVLPGRIR